jgi:hypothetical protein
VSDQAQGDVVRAGLSDSQMRDTLVRLAFDGDAGRLDLFCEAIREAVPPGTAAVLRGSAVTNRRHEDRAPFDADGPGTSDLDLTLVGEPVLGLFNAFYIPGSHSKPLCDEDLSVAPALVPLRERLGRLAGRPVNIQATADWVMFMREHLLGQPYLPIVGKVGTS